MSGPHGKAQAVRRLPPEILTGYPRSYYESVEKRDRRVEVLCGYFFSLFYFLHVLCLCVTFWVTTDLLSVLYVHVPA